MMTDKNHLKSALQKHFGFDRFKGDQEKIITQVLEGKNCFVSMPTGGGKSLCYQLPALMKKGTAIIISPLIALMKNQVDVLRTTTNSDKIACVFNSSLSKKESNRVKELLLNQEIKVLYVSPESLLKEENIALMKRAEISFMAVDEAHCISEWGHDFRPDYRNLNKVVDVLGGIPIIALTATATPKVRDDIIKNLQLEDVKIFTSSFNRPNLYYEVRVKTNDVYHDIVRIVNEYKGKSGIIYCLSRKSVNELTEHLLLNGIKALAYHAGMDAKTRAKNQDDFLKQTMDIVVATVAFGMGIDKPDVRFVIHHSMPKSLEGYYQETGRAGRDGGEGRCIAFYSKKDMDKIAQFGSEKTASENEVTLQLLQEVIAYSETSMSRRKLLLHYFGESFDEENGSGAKMEDNMQNPTPKKVVTAELCTLLQLVSAFNNGTYKSPEIIKILRGDTNAILNAHKAYESEYFGSGKDQKVIFWQSLIQQAKVYGYLQKNYGTLSVSIAAEQFLKNPKKFEISENRTLDSNYVPPVLKRMGKSDGRLLTILKNVRKKISEQHNIPPYAVMGEPSLEEMCIQYPITIDEIKSIVGISEVKAVKIGEKFIKPIKAYVETFDITRSNDLITKKHANKGSLRPFIIQKIDRKIDFDQIAQSKGIEVNEVISEVEKITSHSYLDIDYYINRCIEKDIQDELWNYYQYESKTGTFEEARTTFSEEEYSEEELRLMRIKFLNQSIKNISI